MKSWIKRSIFAFIAVTILGGCTYLYSKRADKPETPKFRTATIDQGAITQVVLATGALQPVITVTVGTQVSGTVLERKADFNDHVTKGQILLRLDPANLEARLRRD